MDFLSCRKKNKLRFHSFPKWICVIGNDHNFYNILFCFPEYKSNSENRSTFKERNLFYREHILYFQRRPLLTEEADIFYKFVSLANIFVTWKMLKKQIAPPLANYMWVKEALVRSTVVNIMSVSNFSHLALSVGWAHLPLKVFISGKGIFWKDNTLANSLGPARTVWSVFTL